MPYLIALARTGGVRQHEIGVLVGFGLGRLDDLAFLLHGAVRRHQRTVGGIAVATEVLGRVLQAVTAFRDWLLGEARREQVGGRPEGDRGNLQWVGADSTGEGDACGSCEQNGLHGWHPPFVGKGDSVNRGLLRLHDRFVSVASTLATACVGPIF